MTAIYSILHCVQYRGLFAFIKPFSALRDEQTVSSFYVPPSVVKGIECTLFGSHTGRIVRSRLTFTGVSFQQEIIQTAGFNRKTNNLYERGTSTLTRGVLLYPELTLAFTELDDAEIAKTRPVLLSRREDLLMPSAVVESITGEEFDKRIGYECKQVVVAMPGAIPMGYHDDGRPIYVLLTGKQSVLPSSLTNTWL
ncbi:hypothetical protein [Spirosoma litoris]